MEMLETQSIYYPRLQLMWLLAGVFAMMLVIFLPYQLFGRYAQVIYLANIGVLLFTLVVAEVGRGGMQAFLRLGSSDRTLQPSEFGKLAMILCFSKVFTQRKEPVRTLNDFLLLTAYMAIPLVLVILQPDFGTAMVYLAVFCIMIFLSGTNSKLLLALFGCALLLVIPIWYAMMNTSAAENFRLTRFLIWLYPEDYPDEARQVINAQIAVGSGGLFGKGIVSPGSYASLGYISDDHTDFIFAVCCESFGMVGACVLVFLYMLLLGRLFYLALRVQDSYGSYLIIGVASMLLFHIVENICMVIGLLPVTGIPLPFMSYGGSNMITNMLGIGLVMNVVMRSRSRERKNRAITNREIRI